MIAELQSEGTDSYRSFTTRRELGRLVKGDLALLLSESFVRRGGRGGRAPSAPSVGDGRGLRTLPVTSTSLIGRDRDVSEVAALLEAREVRLVTLTGPGGVGKTRLAIAVGERLDERYPKGPAFVSLAAIDAPALVLPRIAAAVGLPMDGARPALDVLIEHFADEPALLVLDNLEQIVEIAPELDQLLAQCPGLEILATSRTALRLRAEHEYPVDALAVPAFSDPSRVDELGALPAVQLFVERAQAVRHSFTLTDDNVVAIAEICRLVDGLPLAIELAAARTRVLQPAALLARLERSLDALGTGSVDLPERQRTLRATVEWSYGLLGEAEQQMLATLSVFVDGWTLEAAVDVSDLAEDRTLDLLDALAGHSLVTVDAVATEPRFHMLVAVREFAQERLADTEDRADVERRHAEHFGAFVANADWPTEGHAEWAERIRADEENLRVAIRWFLVHDIAPLPHMFRILWLFWQMRGRMPEGRAWIAEAQHSAATLGDHARAELLLVSAVTATEVGEYESALAAVDGLEALVGHLDDPYIESAAQLAISWILPAVDDFEGALRAASIAFDGFRRQDDPFVGAAALTVGMVESALGNDHEARVHLEIADELGTRYGSLWLRSSARAQLASLEVRAGRLDEARERLVHSVDADDDAELSTLTVTFSLIAAAQLAHADGDARRAAVALGAADGLRSRAGLKAWPSTRRREAELVAQVEEAADSWEYETAHAAGAGLSHREAIAFVRGGS
jgi:predicted ATPase